MPAGPLAVRWLAYDLPPQRAGAVTRGRIQLENAGTAAWRSRPGADVHLSYHWLDRRGNAIVWAGHFLLLPDRVQPGDRIAVDTTLRAPTPPGRYRLAFDLVNEGRFWFNEVGNERLEIEVDVQRRLERRALSVHVAPGDAALEDATRRALTAQEEPLADDGAAATAYLAAGCRPAPDWSRRILDAHDEGFAVVAGSVNVEGNVLERRSAGRELAPWRPGFGRSPTWSAPLLCPSILAGVGAAPAPSAGGLPGLDPADLDEPFLCDGRIRVAVRARALRRAGRPRP